MREAAQSHNGTTCIRNMLPWIFSGNLFVSAMMHSSSLEFQNAPHLFVDSTVVSEGDRNKVERRKDRMRDGLCIIE
jgi:hypothetical protein